MSVGAGCAAVGLRLFEEPRSGARMCEDENWLPSVALPVNKAAFDRQEAQDAAKNGSEVWMRPGPRRARLCVGARACRWMPRGVYS
jgi:hypothetical protein